MPPSERAANRYLDGFMCSQAVFSSFSEDLGLSEDLALRIAEPFGGGIGLMGQTCGAVTGALMVIGLKYGRTRPDDAASKEKTIALAQQFMQQFEATHGSLACRDLLDIDISTPEGLASARENDLFKQRCLVFVASAAELVSELLAM